MEVGVGPSHSSSVLQVSGPAPETSSHTVPTHDQWRAADVGVAFGVAVGPAVPKVMI